MSRILKPALMIMAVLLAPSLALFAGPAGTVVSNEKDIAGIAKRVFPSVVRVVAQNHTRRVATGVVIDKDGYVVTTALMSPRDEKITITTSDGKTVEAEFLGFDTETQLALLKAKDKGLPALPAGKSGDLASGSWVCVVGISPEGGSAVTQGIVSSVAEDRLRLNIWVTPGSSGGPVVDENGRMVGLLRGVYQEEKPVVFQFRDKEQSGSGYVLSRAEAPSSGMAMAVPIDDVLEVTGQIREKGKVQRGWLGVGAALNQDGRVEIGQVDPDSPASLAKLQEGDIVLKLDGKAVSGPAILSAEIRKRKPGQEIVLGIERDGKPMDVKVKLGEFTEDEAKKEMEIRFPGIFPPGRPLEPMPGGPPPGAAPAPMRPKTPGFKTPREFDWSYEKRTFIGVYCGELNPELAAHFGVKEGGALIVSKLTDKGPAQQAGLEVGDVITKADGRRVETVNDLIDLVQAKKKGEKVAIEFLRDKKVMTKDVVVEEEEVGKGEDLESFLDAWQGYTGAFENEIRRWQNDYLPEIQSNMPKLREELAKNGKDSARTIKLLAKPGLRKI